MPNAADPWILIRALDRPSIGAALSLSTLLARYPLGRDADDTCPVIGSVKVRQRCGIFVGLVRFGLVTLYAPYICLLLGSFSQLVRFTRLFTPCKLSPHHEIL